MAEQQTLNKLDLDMEFNGAAGRARKLISEKVLLPSEVAQLQGLFRQSTEGDANNWRLLNDPKLFVKGNEVESEQASWSTLRGMNPLDARLNYIELVENFGTKYNVLFPPSRASSCWSVRTTSTYT